MLLSAFASIACTLSPSSICCDDSQPARRPPSRPTPSSGINPAHPLPSSSLAVWLVDWVCCASNYYFPFLSLGDVPIFTLKPRFRRPSFSTDHFCGFDPFQNILHSASRSDLPATLISSLHLRKILPFHFVYIIKSSHKIYVKSILRESPNFKQLLEGPSWSGLAYLITGQCSPPPNALKIPNFFMFFKYVLFPVVLVFAAASPLVWNIPALLLAPCCFPPIWPQLRPGLLQEAFLKPSNVCLCRQMNTMTPGAPSFSHAILKRQAKYSV